MLAEMMWASMLAGATAIVVIALKCSAPKPKKVWKKNPIIKLDASIDSPSNDLKGLESVLNDLKDQHIKAISLSLLMKEEATEDFKAITNGKKLGTINDLENLTTAITEKGQQVFLE